MNNTHDLGDHFSKSTTLGLQATEWDKSYANTCSWEDYLAIAPLSTGGPALVLMMSLCPKLGTPAFVGQLVKETLVCPTPTFSN